MTCRSRSTRSDARRTRQQGLTLVELLVAIVILGFVMTLVSETVFQVSHVARAADQTTRALTDRWASGWSLAALVANLVVPEESKAPAFTGSERRIQGYTTAPLVHADTGVAPFTLELRPDEQQARTQLVALPQDEFAGEREARVVASFPGAVEFSYVDGKGQRQLAWPPTGRPTQEEELPRAVVVRERGNDRLVMWYPFQGEVARKQRGTNPFETGS